jgi:hypothetical protein
MMQYAGVFGIGPNDHNGMAQMNLTRKYMFQVILEERASAALRRAMADMESAKVDGHQADRWLRDWCAAVTEWLAAGNGEQFISAVWVRETCSILFIEPTPAGFAAYFADQASPTYCRVPVGG